MVTLDDIHREELNICSHLDKICRENGVHYSMIGGTMLGAIRHRGFIPWDDDIDIFMNIKDFRKIEDKITNQDFFLQTPNSDLEMPFAMYKVRKNRSVMNEPGMESLNMHQGLWIDIFVYTDSAKNDFGISLQSKLFLLLKSYRCRYLNRNTDASRKVHALLTKLPRNLQLFIDDLLVKMICCIGSKNSDKYFALDVGKICLYPKKYFDEYDYYKFEDCEFIGPKDYDGFLTMVFGKDYMTPMKWSHLPDYSDVVIS